MSEDVLAWKPEKRDVRLDETDVSGSCPPVTTEGGHKGTRNKVNTARTTHPRRMVVDLPSAV
jgi:hypothetical protein